MNEQARKWGGPAKPLSAAELADHYALCQLAKIYAIGLDTRDYELARSAYADECMIEARDGSMEPVDVSLRRTYGVAASFHATQHFIGNQYVTLEGDEATVWSYGVAYHMVAPGETRDQIIAGVHYRDRAKRFPQGWLIIERKVAMQWMEMAPPRLPGPK